MKKNLLIFFLTATCSFINAQTVYNIADYGAKGDASTVNTESIQNAIDRCTADGGGTVLVPNGTFITGTIHLKNNVALYLDVTAVLKGIGDLEAYSNKALVHAENQDNISISGPGKIHGHGEHPAFQSKDPYNGLSGVRPFAILFDRCSNIRLKEFTLNNSAFWCIKLLQCNNVTVDGINVISRVVANNDGIDITDCFNVRLANCFFDCGDDAVCPKSESEIGVKKLVITNCIIKSESNGIKFGTASIGGFEDIAISNCHIYDTRLAGIALELVDGGVFDRITIDNIVMHNVNGGLFMKLGQRRGDKPGILRNITVSNLIATGIGMWKPDTVAGYYKPPHSPKIGMTLTGQPGYEVENVTLQNIYMQFAGGGTQDDAMRVMGDTPKAYPEYNNYGVTPAYAFNCRHVKNIRFDNVKLDFIKEDVRPALFIEHASNVSVSRLDANISNLAPCFVRCKNVNDLFINTCKPKAAPIPFLTFEGDLVDVTLTGNDFHRVKAIYQANGPINETEIRISGNIE